MGQGRSLVAVIYGARKNFVLKELPKMPTLEWISKEKVINHHQDVPFRVLERQYSFDTLGQHQEDNGSQNMIIHGDNLEALKALLPEYEGRVKCIYIDPPYNTGNEGWIYNDNVNDPKIKKWLGEVVGKEGEDLSRHDKWLCMMYPRLKLLHKLLAEDGAIFISIDDNEQANLKLICDEIFGRDNFITNFIWYSTGNSENQDDITNVHEYILLYAKNYTNLSFNFLVDPNIPSDSKILRNFAENSVIKNGFKNPPSVIELPKGFPCEASSLYLPSVANSEVFINKVNEIGYISRELTKQFNMKYPVNLDELIVENGVLQKSCKVYSGWSNANKVRQFIKNNCEPLDDNGSKLKFFLTKNGVLYYRREGRTSHCIRTVLQNLGTTEITAYMIENMGLKFSYPKPVALIEYLYKMFVSDGDIVLDSFAGSGTTAHAVLNMNKADGGQRRFILIEMMDYADSITAERVKRVIQGYGEGNKAMPGTGGSFSYYELGQPLFTEQGLNEKIEPEKIRRYIWFSETNQPYQKLANPNQYYLGSHNDTDYYFYYEPGETTTLDYEFLATIKKRVDYYVIYADCCSLSEEKLAQFNITFKKIPRDIAKF